MEHIFKTRYKIIKSCSIKDLETELNKFVDKHQDSKVSDIVSHTVNQTGMMLCDRIDPNSNFANIYTVNVEYKYDWTVEQIRAAAAEWARNKIDEFRKFHPYCKEFEWGNFNMTDICDYHSGNAKEYIEYLMTTDEYMEFAKQKEIEYSKE